MREGSTIVIHTTGSPRTARAIAAAAASRGVSVIDSPVSGGPPDIAAGHITLLVGGAGADVERVRPVLAAYGDPILHVGSLGAGQAVKLVNNAVFAANIGLVAQAVALGEQLGVSEEGLLAALPHGSAASRGLSIVAGRGSVATSARGLAEFLGKDVKVVREVAAELGASLGVLDDAIGALEEVTRG
jgi:3-hydroxyisobutyrate dehydrogenase-like beta-hydroxyacid dehydrogenase